MFELRAIETALNEVLPESRPVALHAPSFEGNEWTYVKECIDTGWVSSVGKFVDRFESMLREYTGATGAIAVMNGTAALHICLKLMDVRPGDEVLIPALTFIATANAVAYCGAVPHLVDSEDRTLGMDPVRLENYLRDIAEIRSGSCFNRRTGARIQAIVPMHTFGHCVDMDPLLEVAAKFHIAVIEDAAESLGSYYKGTHTGNFGKVSALSFNGNKIATTGGGGAILTNDESLAKLAKHITTTAKVQHPWLFIHDQVGYNYRMPNLNAALGCAQLEQVPDFVTRKRHLAARYQDAFANIPGVRFFVEPPFSQSNYWLNALILDDDASAHRDELLAISNKHGVMTRPVWTLMHNLPMYKDSPRMDLPVAERLERTIVNLPSSQSLTRAYA